jgi:hypothetical protein
MSFPAPPAESSHLAEHPAMSARADGSIDLISELQLRQWARRNYIPLELRPSTWHPVVLDEMAYRDEERRELEWEFRGPRSAFVPLAPTDMTYVDAAHPGAPAPAGIASAHEARAREFALVDGDDDEEERVAGF